MESSKNDLQKSDQKLKCPLCEFEHSGEPFKHMNCDHSPIMMSWLWNSREEYEGMYQDAAAYHVDQQIEEGQKPYSERWNESYVASTMRLEFMEPYRIRPKMSLMDIGAGNGAFVQAARSIGYVAVGLDPSPMHENTMKGGWEKVAGKWDFITMHDVIEHLFDPREALVFLRDCLSGDGVLVVETPEYYGLGDWKKHIRPKQHLFMLSLEAAHHLYYSCGYEIIAFYRPLRGNIGKMSHFLQRRD